MYGYAAILSENCALISEANACEGDSVEFFGPNISISELADKLDTIPYEILTSISQRVKRIYLQE